MSNPFSGDTTTTGARAGNDTYDNLTSEATDETNAIAAIPGSIGGGVIPKIAVTAGGQDVQEDFVPPPSAFPPDHQKIQQEKFDDIKTTVVAVDDHLERTYVDVINAKKAEIVVMDPSGNHKSHRHPEPNDPPAGACHRKAEPHQTRPAGDRHRKGTAGIRQ